MDGSNYIMNEFQDIIEFYRIQNHNDGNMTILNNKIPYDGILILLALLIKINFF